MNSKFPNLLIALSFIFLSTNQLQAAATNTSVAISNKNSKSILFGAKEIEIDIEKKSLKKPKQKIKQKKATQPKPEEKLDYEDAIDPFDDDFARAPEVDDRFESFNRFMFGVNSNVENYFFEPLTKGYRFVMPEPARLAIRNALDNVGMPARLVSSAVQGEFEKSGRTFSRFLINSTAGVGGLFDVAKDYAGLDSVDEDFDQALASYGTPHGPYLVLPVFGPTSSRHALGKTIDGLLTPSNYFLPFLGNAALSMGEQVNSYSFYIEDKKALDQDALDPYQSMQNFYYQNREQRIKE
jgi:phospholipid-binding lipoprotein MlaA